MYVDVDKFGFVALDDDFVESHRRRLVAWGFGPLSRLIFARSYNRDDENWPARCRRV